MIGFHLPHNAILPKEVEFMLNSLDVNKEYYVYDDIKSLFFEKLVIEDRFKEFHPQVYKNIVNNNELALIYSNIEKGNAKYIDIKNIKYSDKKNFNQIWNETVRDYVEFFAFTGLLPSYYKGYSLENEKRHYVGELLKRYINKEITYSEILYKMKYKNASKDKNKIEEYDVRNRPFVLALKLLNAFKLKGYSEIDSKTIMFYIKNTKNEDTINFDELYPINKNDFNDNDFRELGRASTFMKQHMQYAFNLEIKDSRETIFILDNFDINNYNFKNRAIFMDDIYGVIEITPYLLKSLNDINNINDYDFKDDLVKYNLIDNDNKLLVDFNIDTDLANRTLVKQYLDAESMKFTPSKNIKSKEYYIKGKEISENSDGTKYENFIYEQLKCKFGNCVYQLGAAFIGQRLSDLAFDINVYNEDVINRLRIVVEAKAGNAIKAFDERKEKNNLLNTLTLNNLDRNYDGVWYIVVNGNSIPNSSKHGGYRNSTTQLSFLDKLLQIQFKTNMESQKPTLVTAFSYDKFMDFLNDINLPDNYEYISKVNAPDFWVWSKKFVKESFVTIHAD